MLTRLLFFILISTLFVSCTTTGNSKSPRDPSLIPRKSSVQNSTPFSQRKVSSTPVVEWEVLGAGIQRAKFSLPQAVEGDKYLSGSYLEYARSSRIGKELHVFRASLANASLSLISSSQTGQMEDIAQLMTKRNLALATNAGLFAADYKTSLGYMRNFEHVNNGRHAGKLKGLFVFNPKSAQDVKFKIIEKSEPNWRAEIRKFNTVFETYRMLSKQGENLWVEGNAFYYNTALVGALRSGEVVFIFCPALYSMHDLNEFIKTLPLELEGLLYLDGDSKGALSFNQSGLVHMGYSYFLPNVLAIQFESASTP